jgi:hypothetical protein
LWASLKVIEAFIGYGILGIIILGVVFCFIMSVLDDVKKEKKKNKS